MILKTRLQSIFNQISEVKEFNDVRDFNPTMDFQNSMKLEIERMLNQPADLVNWNDLFELFKKCRAFGFPNYLVLGRPYLIAGNNGDILTLYMDYIGRHSDLYLRCRLVNETGYIYIKVDQNDLLRFLNNELVLQDVFKSSHGSFFYVKSNNYNIQEDALEVSWILNNYCIIHPDKMISQLPEANLIEIQSAIKDQRHYIEIDLKGEENWLLGEPISKIILIA